MPHVLLSLGLAVGSFAYVLTSAAISAPLRLAVEKRAARRRNTGGWEWLRQLLGCPFCVSHWLAFAAVAVYRPWAVDVFRPLDFLVTTFVLVVVAMAAVAVIRLALNKPIGGRS
jgi:hypothetical protein